jgi:hypothetical protein
MGSKGAKGGWRVGEYKYGEIGSDKVFTGSIFLLSDGRICYGGGGGARNSRGSAYSLRVKENLRLHLPVYFPKQEEELQSVLSGLHSLRGRLEAS